MFGLRPDGKKIKNLHPIQKIMPHIMTARHDSQNMYCYPARCEALDKFIKDELENGESFNYMHIVIASLVRIIALRPQLNRFVMNGRIFKREHIYVSFVVKKSLRDDAEETTVKLKFNGTENIYQIRDMINEAISNNNKETATNSTDKLAKVLTRIPNGVIKFAVGTLKWLDKHGMLPGKVLDIVPFHTTIFVTNLKSIKIDYIYHHLYDFGTTSLFVSMGKEKLVPVVDKKELAVGKVMNLGVVTDERFCDGFYFANTLRMWKRVMENPSVLKENLEKKVEDVD